MDLHRVHILPPSYCGWLNGGLASFSALRLPQPSPARLWSSSLVRPRQPAIQLSLTASMPTE
ncbi:MAG: hypothetical protein ACXVCI_12940, partial [Bdellovibrionota bacterium]